MSHSDYNLEQGTPAFFIQGPSLFARFVFYAILSVSLIVTDSRLQYLSDAREQLESYLHPFALMANAPAELYTKLDQYLTGHDQLVVENKALRKALLKANIDAQSNQSLTVENNQLRQLMHVEKRIKQPRILAEILHASSDQFTKEVVINRGAAHQVKLGASVVDAKGVVGQVTRLYPQTSLVTLITNKSMEIPVMIERNGLRAIAFGFGQNNLLEIPYLPSTIDIKEGDRLVTSGIDFVYPTGYAIGKVEKITNSPGTAFISILCSVTGGVDLHRHVLVVNPLSKLIDLQEEKAILEDVPEAGVDEKEANDQAQATKSYMSRGVIHASE